MTRTGLALAHLDRRRSCSIERIDATGDFLCREGEAADIDTSALRRLCDLSLRCIDDDSVPARGWPCS
jgi:hypothetical protein